MNMTTSISSYHHGIEIFMEEDKNSLISMLLLFNSVVDFLSDLDE